MELVNETTMINSFTHTKIACPDLSGIIQGDLTSKNSFRP